MKIKKLKLYTNDIAAQTNFYDKSLGFKAINKSEEQVSFRIGNSILSFEKSDQDYKYHYCFLIPSNKLNESIAWLEKRLKLIKSEDNNIIQDYKSWNAHSIYFYDGTGNVVEFIVRHDLRNKTSEDFNHSQIISINEIGLVTTNIKSINETLEKKLNTKFWKGDLTRFGTNGDQNGLFLLINNELKKYWFPTEVKTEVSPFEAKVEVDGNIFNIDFIDGALSINLKPMILN